VPLLAVPFVLLVACLTLIALLPLSLVQRYRVGTARRPARGWLATINVAALIVSAVIFLISSALTNVWVPNAFVYTLSGLLAGCALGVLGLAVTRWETTPAALYYTPSRVLVLAITLVVTARVAYGFWRGWYAWRAFGDDPSWLVASGAAGAMAAGAVVVGYYLSYWLGVRRRFKRHQSGEVQRRW